MAYQPQLTMTSSYYVNDDLTQRFHDPGQGRIQQPGMWYTATNPVRAEETDLSVGLLFGVK